MKAISATDLRAHFSKWISQVAFAKKRVQIMRQGKAVAGIVPIEDLELLEKLEDQYDIREAKRAREEIKKEGTISLDQALKDLDLD